MPLHSFSRTASRILAATVLSGGLFLAGCDEHVQIVRDSTIPVRKHQTWAWKPATAPSGRNNAGPGGNRPVISRDVIRRNEPLPAQPDAVTDITRREFRAELERQLNSKGLSQVSDPAAADFLVDYHLAVRGRNVTVERVYPGGYGGLVCGPFGCYNGWGWGPPEVSYQNVRFHEGTFVLDVLQNSTRHLAYRAIGQEPVHRDQFSRGQLEDMVHALLKGLKPRG